MSSIRTAQQNTIAAVAIRDGGNVSRAIATISVRDISALHTVFSSTGGGAVQALMPAYVQGSVYSKGTAFVSTEAATVKAPSGATVVWNFADAGWSAINPTAPTTAFRKSVAPGDEAETTVTCTVMANGSSYTTNGITAHVENTFGGLN